MFTELIISYNPKNEDEVIDYFSYFIKEFSYLNCFKLKFSSDVKYGLYKDDLVYINSGMPELASLIDTRSLKEHKHEPIRILLRDGFFRLNKEEKNENILHEIGHLITNPNLLKIRQYISENSPEKILVKESKYQKLIDYHNKGLIYLFDLLKLKQEVSADVWLYHNELEYSEKRNTRYCNGINNKFDENNKNKLFYKIPFFNFHIIYRYSLINKIDLKIKDKCLTKIDKANKRLYEIAKRFEWNELKQLKYQKDILEAISSEKHLKLIKLYEENFKEYIQISSSFFPRHYQDEILDIYLKKKRFNNL